MDVQIRPITADELERHMMAVEAAFSEHPTPEWIELHRPFVEIDRTLVAVEGDEFVGGAGANSFVITVPGPAELPVAGVTSVGVKPTHRRRGINTALMRRQLDDIHERGEPVAALFASEGGIYGLYGYGLASFNAAISLETSHAAFVRGYAPTGRVRLYEREDALKAFLSIYDRARLGRPGMVRLDERGFAFRFDERHIGEKDARWFFAGHEVDGGVDAYAVYRVKHEWEQGVPRSSLLVEDVQGVTPRGYADVWRYLLDVDLVHVVTAWDRPADEPLLHLLREPRRLNLRLRDALWVRVVDVQRALESRGYAAEGRVVLAVSDAFCPWNEGRYALETGPDGASCRPTEDDVDIALTINELGTVYLGGFMFSQLARAARLEEARAGAVATADAMFAVDAAPHCAFMF